MLKGNKVWTPNGYQDGPTNSLVGKGESIIDYTNGTGTLVTKGKVGVDNQPSSVSTNDNNVIAGNDIDWSNGMKFSDQVAPLTAKLQMYNNIEKRVKENKLDSLSKQTKRLQTTQIQQAKTPILDMMKNITDRQQMQHQVEDYNNYIKHNCGKDRFDNGKSLWDKTKQAISNWSKSGKGKVPNLMIDAGYAFPALLETQMLNHWRNEKPIMPNIYAANRYAPIALQTMAGNRISANPILEKLYAQDRQAAYQLANSGGYTGGQRQANRVALALGNQRNVADALMNVQEKNAAYRNAYAEMAARLGDSDAQRLQQSNQYGWEAYNKAHGAKTKGIETHLSNLGLIGQKWLSQRIKNKQYEDTLGLYQQDIDNRRLALKGLLEGDKNTPLTSNKSVNTPQLKNKFDPMNLHYGNYTITRLGEPGSILWRNYQKIMNDHDNVLKNAYLKEAYDKQMYGDNGGGFMNFKIGDQFSIPTNKTYLNSYTPYEWIAGTDDMEMMAKKPSTYSGIFPYGMDINKLINSVNNLRYK